MHNSRQNLLKTILGNNNMNKNKPVLTLNMSDKLYLAVAKNFTDALSFVYTLACNKAANSDKYDMVATPQIHTFRDKASARVYHDTVAQLVEANEANAKYKILFDLNKHQIEDLMTYAR